MKMLKAMSMATLLSALAVSAWADDCSVTIDSSDQMRFDKATITIDSSCEAFTVNVTHSGKLPRNVMGHNWALTKTEDLAAVARDGIQAGLDNNYVLPNDGRVLAYTPIIGGGESTSISFDPSGLLVGGEYSFLCTFPGHSALMKGAVVVK